MPVKWCSSRRQDYPPYPCRPPSIATWIAEQEACTHGKCKEYRSKLDIRKYFFSERVPSINFYLSSCQVAACCCAINAQNTLDTFPRNIPIDGEVANLLPAFWQQVVVMESGKRYDTTDTADFCPSQLFTDLLLTCR